MSVSAECRTGDGADSPQLEVRQLRHRLEEAERMVYEQRLVIEASTGGPAAGHLANIVLLLHSLFAMCRGRSNYIKWQL